MFVKFGFTDLSTGFPVEIVIASRMAYTYKSYGSDSINYGVTLDGFQYNIEKTDYDNITAILLSTNDRPILVEEETPAPQEAVLEK